MPITRSQAKKPGVELAPPLAVTSPKKTKKQERVDETAKILTRSEKPPVIETKTLLQKEVAKLEARFPVVMNVVYSVSAKVQSGVSSVLAVVPSTIAKVRNLPLPSRSDVSNKVHVYVHIVADKASSLVPAKVKEVVAAVSARLGQYFAKAEKKEEGEVVEVPAVEAEEAEASVVEVVVEVEAEKAPVVTKFEPRITRSMAAKLAQAAQATQQAQHEGVVTRGMARRAASAA